MQARRGRFRDRDAGEARPVRRAVRGEAAEPRAAPEAGSPPMDERAGEWAAGRRVLTSHSSV